VPPAHRTISPDDLVAGLERIGRFTMDGRAVEGSRTAFATAFLRAFHSANESHPIFDDRVAAKLLTEEEYALFEEAYYQRALKASARYGVPGGSRKAAVCDAMRRGAAGGVLVRARFTEDLLEKAVAGGMRQYVILGAGLDTFALRRADLMERILTIEVDLPGMQAIKRERLAALGPLPPSLEFVPVDFSREELLRALSRSRFDPGLPVFFSWLGVTYYLERGELFLALRGLAEIGAPGSLLAFDYMDADAFDRDKASRQVQRLQDRVRWLGEPMKTGLDPDGLEEALAGAGWKLQQDLSGPGLEEICVRAPSERFHIGRHVRLALASRAA
jgi:methyltransferase (TIGR00027 family)